MFEFIFPSHKIAEGLVFVNLWEDREYRDKILNIKKLEIELGRQDNDINGKQSNSWYYIKKMLVLLGFRGENNL